MQIICDFLANIVQILQLSTNTLKMLQEKLKELIKEKGFTQNEMAKILSTDTSNYSRKERGEVRIHDDEWEKMAKTLDVPLEELKEAKNSGIHNENFTFHDYSGNNVNYYSIPNPVMDNLQDYIAFLKEESQSLKEENKNLKKELEELKNRKP